MKPSPLRTTAAIADDAFDAIRRHLVLDACKWDPQIGDIDTLARQLFADEAPHRLVTDAREKAD